jgi:HSP20 family protein
MNNNNNQNFDPRKGFNVLRDTVNRVIEDGLTIANSIANGAQMLPVDVYETETAVVVKAGPIVGVKPENIDVSLVGDTLTIKGEAVPEEQINDESYLRRERRFGSFARSVTIPRPVKADQAQASFKDAILTITLPKTEEEQPKIINVKPVDS